MLLSTVFSFSIDAAVTHVRFKDDDEYKNGFGRINGGRGEI